MLNWIYKKMIDINRFLAKNCKKITESSFLVMNILVNILDILLTFQKCSHRQKRLSMILIVQKNWKKKSILFLNIFWNLFFSKIKMHASGANKNIRLFNQTCLFIPQLSSVFSFLLLQVKLEFLVFFDKISLVLWDHDLSSI